MRTFIFIKHEHNYNGEWHKEPQKIIVGMAQSEMFPSGMTNKGAKFENCDCVEVTENCYIKL